MKNRIFQTWANCGAVSISDRTPLHMSSTIKKKTNTHREHTQCVDSFMVKLDYLSPFKFRLPLIFAPFNFCPFNFRPFNFRHPLLKISLPLIFATFSKFEFVSIYLKFSNRSRLVNIKIFETYLLQKIFK